jgi:hypothetical protein
MMTAMLPPMPAGNDALALLTALSDPAAAKKKLEEIVAAHAAATTAVAENTKVLQQITTERKAHEQALARLEAASERNVKQLAAIAAARLPERERVLAERERDLTAREHAADAKHAAATEAHEKWSKKLTALVELGRG